MKGCAIVDAEPIITGGKIAAAIASIATAAKLIPKAYKWLRSWKIIKVRDYDHLKKIETEHQKCSVKQTGYVPLSPPALKPKEYEWRNFLWLLRQSFWDNCNDLAVDQASDTFLATAIHGPLCPNCKVDLSRIINAKKSACSCSREFNLKEIGTLRYPAEALRRSVYTHAQAAVRRGDLSL